MNRKIRSLIGNAYVSLTAASVALLLIKLDMHDAALAAWCAWMFSLWCCLPEESSR
ncbi:MAG: hypothetical protein ACRCYZ_06860 [Alphaproteobacteria bacterium]